MERSDVRVGDREAAAVKGVEEARGDEPARGEHRVPTRPGRGPHEPGAGRRIDEREHRGQRAHGDAAVEARQRRVGHRLVHRAALRVEGLEALPLARQRPPAARGAPPRRARVDVDVHDRVIRERLARGLGPERTAAERHHSRVGPAQELDGDPLLAAAELGLALPVEEGLDRLAQGTFELRVRVERALTERRRHRARRARLAGAHEADEHEGRAAPGVAGRALAGRGYRLHAIRSM